jgi:hypothetical protein
MAFASDDIVELEQISDFFSCLPTGLANGWAFKSPLFKGVFIDLVHPLSRCPDCEGVCGLSTAPPLKALERFLSGGLIVVTPWDIGVCIDDFHPLLRCSYYEGGGDAGWPPDG